MASKLDVLQRYMADGKDKEKKKRKKIKSSSHVGMRVIDDDGDDWQKLAPNNKKKDLWQNDTNAYDEDLPMVVDTDYDPEYQPVITNAEEFFERERAEELEKQWQDSAKPTRNEEKDASPPRKSKRHSDDDNTPPRRSRKDSDASPPRRSRNDSDASPPRRSRKDSDVSPPRRSRNDSDASPPRRSHRKPDQSPTRQFRKDFDTSPPRRSRNDSNVSSPPRRQSGFDKSPSRRPRKDSDASPPRRSRKDSDASPPRRRRHDSDVSLPRRSYKNGDQSPPRRSRRGSDASPSRKSYKDSDASPVRRPNDSNKISSHRSSESPRRGRRRSPSPLSRRRSKDRSYSPRRRHRSRSSSRRYQRERSPPRRSSRRSRSRSNRRSRYSRSPRRDNKKRTPSPQKEDHSDRGPASAGQTNSKAKSPLSSQSPNPEEKAPPSGGVYTGKEFREIQERDRKQNNSLYEDEELMGKQAETVYRDKRGRKLDMLMEMERQREIQEGKRKREAVEEYEWGTGKVRKEEIKSQRQELEDIKSKPFARYKDDEELDATLRGRSRNFDPMESSLFKDGDAELLLKSEKKKKKNQKPKYSGPPAPPNRFNIRPGYRWDGIVRGNNWEEKVLLRQNKSKADKADAYQYATADISDLVSLLESGYPNKMFKVRAKKEKRKRSRVDDEEGSDEITLNELHELKEDLKHRERLKRQRTPLVVKNVETSVTNTLDGQFTLQSNMTTADQFAKIMNNYVETRLKEKYLVNDTNDKEPALTEEQELYRIPDHLRKKMNIPDKAPEGGIITWNTGIAEVELPQEMHEQVIQATKEALEQQQHYEETKHLSSALPTNISANFKKHKHDYINDLKNRSREEQRAKNFQLVNKNDATDDHMMRKFRREQSRKRY